MPEQPEEGWVSMWVGFVRHAPDVDLLRDLCGVEYYDLDDQEVIVDGKAWKHQPVAELIGALSYSESFKVEALTAAEAAGISEALFVLAQYDFVYDPKQAVGPVAPDPVYLGSFAWKDDEDEL